VRLTHGRTLDNRDFVLRYTLAGTRTQAGLLAYRDPRGGFFSLLLEPPQVPAANGHHPPRNGVRAGLLRLDARLADGRQQSLHAGRAAATAAYRQFPHHSFQRCRH
jgi:hypothetical protein